MSAGGTRFTTPPPLLLQGALTHGDRRATESRDLSQFNIDNKVSGVPHQVSRGRWLPVLITLPPVLSVVRPSGAGTCDEEYRWPRATSCTHTYLLQGRLHERSVSPPIRLSHRGTSVM